MRRKLQELFGIDLRSLAAFRIALGLVLALDQLCRLRDLHAHYTDWGILPRHSLGNRWWAWHGLLHHYSGEASYQAALLWISVGLALALMFGFHTRWAAFLSWLFLISLHTRNPYILQGSDLLFRSLLFWSIFLPLEARWSIDAARKRFAWEEHRPKSVYCAASAALLLQVCLVYWCSGLLKSYSDWVTEGTAVRDALLTDCWTTDFGRSLLAYPELLRRLTQGTYWLEVIGPTLAFSPLWTGPIRILVVLSFFLFHVPGLGTTMLLGAFPYVSALSWLVFLPSSFWDWIERRVSSKIPDAAGEPEATVGFASGAPIRSTRPINLLVATIFLYVLLWNLQIFQWGILKRFPTSFWSAAYTLRLDQRWNMFAPYPARQDGWYVIVGTTEDGWQMDLFRGGTAVVWSKPPRVSDHIPSYRWRSYLTHLWRKQGAPRLPEYARYLCRWWNSTHHGPNRIVALEIYYLCEEIVDGKQEGRPKRYLLYEHQCATDPWDFGPLDLPGTLTLPDLPSDLDNT